MRRSTVGAALLLAVAAGCATPAPLPPTSPAAPTPGPGPSAAGDAAACSAEQGTSAAVTAIVRAVRNGPVLPAAIALFLLDARDKAGRPVADPALAKAQAELVAAIDDLDAQGRAALPPGGDAAKDVVRLDGTRIAGAVAAVDRACAGAGLTNPAPTRPIPPTTGR